MTEQEIVATVLALALLIIGSGLALSVVMSSWDFK